MAASETYRAVFLRSGRTATHAAIAPQMKPSAVDSGVLAVAEAINVGNYGARGTATQ